MFDRIKHALIRHKAELKNLPTSRFSVSLASSTDDYAQAFNLVQVSYASLGIAHLGRRLFRMTEQHVLPEAFVLLAREGDQVVGTITVTLDSPAGVPLDKDYPEVLTPLRRMGARLAEIGSYAVVSRRRHSGVAQLLGVAAARLIWSLGCTHTAIGIHPKVTPIYAALWGFKNCGPQKAHQNLSAPVAAMVVSREEQEEHAFRFHGRHRESRRTIEDLVFGPRPIPNTNLERHADQSQVRPGMNRETFQELFMQKSDHLGELSQPTLRYLRSLRSEETLGAFTVTDLGGTGDRKHAMIQPPRDLRKNPLRSFHRMEERVADRPVESGLMWLN